MAQTSGPITGQNLTDEMWRTMFGAEPGILGDTNGTAFALTLPPGSDDAEVGAPANDSNAVVAGFGIRIPSGEPEPLAIPPSNGGTVGRTDLIVARYDPSWSSTNPGPVRLHRIAGVDGSPTVPSFDSGAPGVEDMPLWQITRRQGEGLNQAAVVDRRRWIGPAMHSAQAMHSAVPIGTTVLRGDTLMHRRLVGGTAQWFEVDLTGRRGERPQILIGRAAAFAYPTSASWASLSSDTPVLAGNPASVGMAVIGSGTQDNPTRIRLSQAGLYAFGYRMGVRPTATPWPAFHASSNPGVFAGPGFGPTSQVGVEELDHPGGNVLRYLSGADTRWIRAGTEIGLVLDADAAITVASWRLWATWLGN